MAAPKLVYAKPNGQTSVLVLFDQKMRQLPSGAVEDPANAVLWSTAGLPTVASVIRHSPTEFELVFSSPASIGAGTVTVAATVQSSTGEAIDPAFLTVPVAISTPDLTLDSLVWTAPAEFDLVFSEALAQIIYDAPEEVLTVAPVNPRARQTPISGLVLSGTTLRVTLDNPGTAGAAYKVSLNREVFQSQATAVVLRSGMETRVTHGQGDFPTIASLTVTETSLGAIASEVIGAGWPLFPGPYTVSAGSLGTAAEVGASPSAILFPAARFADGANVTFSVRTQQRTVGVGESLTAQASSVVGAGTEAVGVSTTTINKTSGNPFEVVFSGGSDSFVTAGRRLESTLSFSFTPDTASYTVLAITFLNSQVSVLLRKTADNLATLQLYRGAKPVGAVSEAFDPTVPFTLDVIDATAEAEGFFGVAVNDVFIGGGYTKDLIDPLLKNGSAGVTATAWVFGSPATPTQTFSVTFHQPIITTAFTTTGFLGQQSRDLLSFDPASSVVLPAEIPLPTGGYENTGAAAFGVSAEYVPGNDEVRVLVALNEQATPLAFSGSVTLMTGDQQPMDQVLFDQGNRLIDSTEIPVVFFHPKLWAGAMIGVSLDINGTTYSAITPVIMEDEAPIQSLLTQQPASWPHPRVPRHTGSTGAETFGPAAITNS